MPAKKPDAQPEASLTEKPFTRSKARPPVQDLYILWSTFQRHPHTTANTHHTTHHRTNPPYDPPSHQPAPHQPNHPNNHPTTSPTAPQPPHRYSPKPVNRDRPIGTAPQGHQWSGHHSDCASQTKLKGLSSKDQKQVRASVDTGITERCPLQQAQSIDHCKAQDAL